MNRLLTGTVVTSAISLIIILLAVGAAYGSNIAGKIVATDQSPIVAANIKLLCNDSLRAWAISDTCGNFEIDKISLLSSDIGLEINAIGYKTKIISLTDNRDLVGLKIVLDENPIDFGSIIVETPKSEISGQVHLSAEKITDKARRSIIPTNSTYAIRQPQVIRDGSVQSSRIRINGTIPSYSINGTSIGDNPNHYGMFNIIASPNLNGLDFYAEGTSAQHESPSVVEFKTLRPFKTPFKGETDLSFIEGTNLAVFGTSRFFAMTSIRKSILDLLVKKAPFKSDRLTIPPTSFMDWFASAGVKLSSDLTLTTDQYYSNDYLSYSLSGTQRNPSGLNINQNTEAHFISLRLESTGKSINYRVETSTRTGAESYNVAPIIACQDTSMRVSLQSNQCITDAKAEISFLLGNTIISGGNTVNYMFERHLSLRQRNWNFLPPDASSDNPYFYQPELDYLYGSIKVDDNELNNASYITIREKLGRFEAAAGLRQSYFQRLHTRWHIDYRLSIDCEIKNAGALNLFYGTFSESPVKRILEPYQVLTRAWLNNLNPISTKQLSLNYTLGKIKLGAFKKKIEQLPILVPDFTQVNIDHLWMGNGFLAMQPIGKLAIYGGDITLDLTGFPAANNDLAISYGYSHSRKDIRGKIIPYELDAPHKINIDLSYKLGRIVSLGGSLTGRSGYPYTKPVNNYDNRTPSRYSETYYQSLLMGSYSSRFPFNYQTSIYLNFDWEHSHLYLTILNLTNRKNPIISSADGYVYDNGILPSLGFSYKF